jgi:SAM-dependent methyltransferase
VEVGCGVGINAFELAKAARRADKEVEYVGVDLSVENIKAARSVCVSMGLSNVRFCVADAVEFLQTKLKTLPGFELGADAVFLMDVVEHIHEPQVLLQHAHAALKSGGVYVVSVPTPLYPRVFGRYMHQRVGHVVDGYDRGALDAFFEQGLGCERLQLRYNTGFPCNLGCSAYYRLHSKNRYLNVVKCLALYPFRYADWLNGKRVSCSLFAVYRKS